MEVGARRDVTERTWCLACRVAVRWCEAGVWTLSRMHPPEQLGWRQG